MKGSSSVLKLVGRTLTQAKSVYAVRINPKTPFCSLWQKVGLLPKEKRVPVSPVTLGTLIRVSQTGIEAIEAQRESLKTNTPLIEYAARHMHILPYIVAAILSNTKEEPGEELVDFVRNNITIREAWTILSHVHAGLDISDFIKLYEIKKPELEEGEEPVKDTNNPWGLVGSVAKYFRLNWDEILWENSYVNIAMLLTSIPTYKSKADKGKDSGGAGNKNSLAELEDFFKQANF